MSISISSEDYKNIFAEARAKYLSYLNNPEPIVTSDGKPMNFHAFLIEEAYNRGVEKVTQK